MLAGRWQVELRNLVENWIGEFRNRCAKSRFHLINCRLAGIAAAEPERVCWILDQANRIEEVEFPAATNLDARWCAENAGS